MTTPDEIYKNFIKINNKLYEQENLLSSNKREIEYSQSYIKTMMKNTWSLTITDKVYIIQANKKLTYYEELILKNEEEIKKLNEELQNEFKVFEPEFLKFQQEYLNVPE
jgi:hypothetical protein